MRLYGLFLPPDTRESLVPETNKSFIIMKLPIQAPDRIDFPVTLNKFKATLALHNSTA